MDLKRQKEKVFGPQVTKINIFGVWVDDISAKDAVDRVLRLAEAKQRENYVVTVNTEFVMNARREREFGKILNNANLAVADGWWVAFSKLIEGGSERYRITGVELVENVCKKVADRPITVGFLGGFGTVAALVAKRQKLASPRLKVAYAGPGDETISQDSRLKVPKGLQGRIDILFVALGMGRQEYWIEKWKTHLNVGVFIGVGGAFDYLAGVKKRAPSFVQNSGFEWLWRLIMEPSRLWRQRVIPAFFVMILWRLVVVKIFGQKS